MEALQVVDTKWTTWKGLEGSFPELSCIGIFNGDPVGILSEIRKRTKSKGEISYKQIFISFTLLMRGGAG